MSTLVSLHRSDALLGSQTRLLRVVQESGGSSSDETPVLHSACVEVGSLRVKREGSEKVG